jgi:hypothetical protein
MMRRPLDAVGYVYSTVVPQDLTDSRHREDFLKSIPIAPVDN